MIDDPDQTDALSLMQGILAAAPADPDNAPVTIVTSDPTLLQGGADVISKAVGQGLLTAEQAAKATSAGVLVIPADAAVTP